MNSKYYGWSSPAKYIQGKNIIKDLYKFCSPYGKRAFVLITPSCIKLTSQIKEEFSKGGIVCDIKECGSESSESEIEYYSNLCNGGFIVGIGGGRVIDITKAVANHMEIPCIIVPSTLTTDAPATSRSVVYNSNGSSYALKFDHSPELIVVDSELILTAPVRYFIAGIGDAITTRFEAEANKRYKRMNLIKGDFLSTYVGVGISKLCYEILLREGKKAVSDVIYHRHTEAVEQVIEAVLLMSGLGSENCGCGIAHSIGEGISLVPVNRISLHGEQVAFGLICQLYAENRKQKEIDQLIRYYLDVGLPVSLEDLGINPDLHIDVIAGMSISRTCWQEALREPIVDVSRVIEIIKTANETGNRIKNH